MTILLARLRQAARWAWALLLPVGAVLAYVFHVRRRIPQQPVPLDAAIEKSRRLRLEAEAKATVEIAIAREQNKAKQAELIGALRDADEDAQMDRLIELGRKIRGE